MVGVLHGQTAHVIVVIHLAKILSKAIYHAFVIKGHLPRLEFKGVVHF